MTFERGLREVSKEIALDFGLNDQTLHGEQLALIEQGVFKKRPGKGPGSGVEYTPQNLAILLCSLLSKQRVVDLAAIASNARMRAMTRNKGRLT